MQFAQEAFRCFEPYNKDEGQSYAQAAMFVPELCENEVVHLLKEIQQQLPTYNTDYENVFSAEQNAIIYASKNNVPLENCCIYVTLAPCLSCARIIFASGIKKVIYLNSYAEYKGIGVEEGVAFLTKFGIEVVRYKK